MSVWSERGSIFRFVLVCDFLKQECVGGAETEEEATGGAETEEETTGGGAAEPGAAEICFHRQRKETRTQKFTPFTR